MVGSAEINDRFNSPESNALHEIPEEPSHDVSQLLNLTSPAAVEAALAQGLISEDQANHAFADFQNHHSPAKLLTNVDEVEEAVKKGVIPMEMSLKAMRSVKRGEPFEVVDKRNILTGSQEVFKFENEEEVDRALEEGGITEEEAVLQKIMIRGDPADIDADLDLP